MQVKELIAVLQTLPETANVEENSEGMLIDSVWLHKGQNRVILDNSSNDPNVPAPGWIKVA